MTSSDVTHSGAFAGAGLRILLVEDNPGDARLIRERLRETEGLVAELAHATSLGEAVGHLRNTGADVALLDLGLPDSSGLEAVEAVTGAAPTVPIIVLTGLDDGMKAIEALRIGAQDYLSKDWLDSGLLERAVRYAVERMRTTRRAQEAIHARDRVLGIVAHDLRNPLGCIAMTVELMAGDYGSAEQRAEQLDVIRRSAARMDRLIADLLDVVRIENGQFDVDLTHQDPDALAREAVELNAALAAGRSVRLELEAPGRCGSILGDRDRVMQLLSNLVGNAIQFTPAGGRVVLGVQRFGESARFRVEDNGPGIPAEDLEHLFDPFWQARRTPSSGVGLGLTIARGIVDAHGGTIWAESEVGIGTRIFFTIPLADKYPKVALETKADAGGVVNEESRGLLLSASRPAASEGLRIRLSDGLSGGAA